jgi:hypothetical protein
MQFAALSRWPLEATGAVIFRHVSCCLDALHYRPVLRVPFSP